MSYRREWPKTKLERADLICWLLGEEFVDCAHDILPDLVEDIKATNNEIASVLMLMDGLAEQWGDEAVFRRCRDRLRALVNRKFCNVQKTQDQQT
jgi:hypothetical protein